MENFAYKNFIHNNLYVDMREVKIVSLPNKSFSLWVDGKNLNLNNDINIGEVIKVLNACIKYLMGKI